MKEDAALKKVFITYDLTHKQQEADKKLRNKRQELKANGNAEYRLKHGKMLQKLASRGSVISTPLELIKDEISDRITVHVNRVNNVHDHGIKSLNCLYVNVRSLVNK